MKYIGEMESDAQLCPFTLNWSFLL